MPKTYIFIEVEEEEEEQEQEEEQQEDEEEEHILGICCCVIQLYQQIYRISPSHKLRLIFLNLQQSNYCIVMTTSFIVSW